MLIEFYLENPFLDYLKSNKNCKECVRYKMIENS